MPTDQIFVCALVLVTMALFIWEKISADLVAIGALFLLLMVPFHNGEFSTWWQEGAQPILDHKKDLGKVFGTGAAVAVACMFIVGAALDRTGLVERFGAWFARLAGTNERRIMLVLAVIVIPISAFMNNTTVVVIFMPVILGLCRQNNLLPSRFLIPLSYLSIAGGMCTLIGTSTNIIVSERVAAKGLAPFGFFEIAPLGLIISVVTTAYLIFARRRLLPERATLASLINNEDGREFLTAAIISETSPLVGKTLPETALAKNRAMRVIEIRRSGNRLEQALDNIRFEPGDRVILKTHLSGVMNLNATEGLEVAAKSELGLSYVRTEKAVIMEAILGPRSRLVGRSLSELNFRQQFGVLILAVHRHGENLRENFENVKLEFGDTLLIEGSPERVRQLFEEKDFINLSEPKKRPEDRSKKAPIAIGVLIGLVILGTCNFTFLPFEMIALMAALIILVTGCLSSNEGYQAIDWNIMFMLFGTIGLGLAMDKSGAAETIVDFTVKHASALGPKGLLIALFGLTIIMTELLSNNAVAVIMTPLAIQLAQKLGVDWHPFVVAVMFGSSIGFAVPAGYQTHMLVYGAGGYKFGDFIRVGLPLDIIAWIVGSIMIPLIWPL
jgi:di/tricarboxylate transporter